MEVQKDSLPHPVVHYPFVASLLCNAQLTAIETIDGVQHRLTKRMSICYGCDISSALEGFDDDVLVLVHDFSSVGSTASETISPAQHALMRARITG